MYYIFLIVPFFFSAQILQQFPRYQTPYVGGYKAYYKDFHDIILAKSLQPCSDKEQYYQLKLLINKDNSVSFIKDHNDQNIAKNKCAYDLAREVAQYQKNWNAALVDGIPVDAVADFSVFPADLFENYTQGYTPNFTSPIYGDYRGNGAEEFRKGIINRIDVRRFSWNDKFSVIIDFIITKESKIENFLVIKSSSMVEFDNQIISGIKSTKKRWKAATINGKPVDYRYRLTINAITDRL